jgi:hypothetical protein
LHQCRHNQCQLFSEHDLNELKLKKKKTLKTYLDLNELKLKKKTVKIDFIEHDLNDLNLKKKTLKTDFIEQSFDLAIKFSDTCSRYY